MSHTEVPAVSIATRRRSPRRTAGVLALAIALGIAGIAATPLSASAAECSDSATAGDTCTSTEVVTTVAASTVEPTADTATDSPTDSATDTATDPVPTEEPTDPATTPPADPATDAVPTEEPTDPATTPPTDPATTPPTVPTTTPPAAPATTVPAAPQPASPAAAAPSTGAVQTTSPLIGDFAGSALVSSTNTRLLAEVAAATSALATAQSRLDAAKRDYDQSQLSYERAVSNAKVARQRASDAEALATASAAQFILKVRGASGQTPGGTVGGIMFDGGSGNLLQKLSTAHQLGQTNATPTQLSERATRDGTRAHAARIQAIKAAATAAQIPVASKRAAMDAAQADVDAAQSALDTARSRLAATTPTLDIPAFDSSGLLSGSAWVDPVRGPITDRFGPRPSQPLGTSLFHPGDDIGAACLSWIGAASAGTVVATGPFSGYGNWVVIDHGDGVQTVYGHIVDGGTAVSVGQQVLAGQPIARVGSTGLSTGCHLHLEVRVNGQQIDPMPFFAIRGVVVGG